MLLPTTVGSTAHPNLILVGNKGGTFYLIDRNNMGKFNATADHVVQETTLGRAFSSPVYFNGHLYVTPNGAAAEEFSISHGVINPTPLSHSAVVFTYPGANASLSANGTTNGIIWEIDNKNANTLLAYSASGYNKLLFSAVLDSSVKFAAPTVADGQVFAASADKLYLFGLKQVSLRLLLRRRPAEK